MPCSNVSPSISDACDFISDDKHAQKSKNLFILCLFISLIFLGCVNFLSYKVNYSAYGEEYSFFVSQGINLLFILYGGCVLYPMQYFTDIITPRMTRIPKSKFFIMGFLDCFGTFFTAMGSVYTPGQFQTLLNQCLIPLTMFASLSFLKTRYNRLQIIGAIIIVSGALSVVLPTLLTKTDGFGPDKLRWYSCLIYVLSNIPMACSAVYKEHAFKNEQINVYYLQQWVSIFQFFIGFFMAPLQMIPGIGGNMGYTVAEIIDNFVGGARCAMGAEPACDGKHTFLLITGYCAVNFLFTTMGLFMTKHASANLTATVFAVLLPLTTILFSFHFMGSYQEEFNVYTVLGLIIILSGVSLYQWNSTEMIAERQERQEKKSKAQMSEKSPLNQITLTVAH